MHQKGHGRLAVGTGDADHAQPPTRLVVPAGSQHRQRGTRILHVHEEDAGIPVFPVHRHRFAHDRDGSTLNGLVNEQVAVGLEAPNGYEQASRPDQPAVHGQVIDR